MWRITLLATLVLLSGCGETPQPASGRAVAAFEIPLPSAHDRDEFLAVVRREAEAEGLHVDAASPDALQGIAEASPAAAMTVHAAVWRGSEDDQLEASITDQYDHLGRVWIVFLQGEHPELARRFRVRLMSTLIARWRGTLSLPILSTGAIPNPHRLRRRPDGYVLDDVDADRGDATSLRTRSPSKSATARPRLETARRQSPDPPRL